MTTWEPIWPAGTGGLAPIPGRRLAALRVSGGGPSSSWPTASGVSRVAVSHLEAGINTPDARTVALLAGAVPAWSPTTWWPGPTTPSAKADRLPLVVARHTEVEHQVALMEADLAWVEGPDARGGRPRRRGRGAPALAGRPWPSWPPRSSTPTRRPRSGRPAPASTALLP